MTSRPSCSPIAATIAARISLATHQNAALTPSGPRVTVDAATASFGKVTGADDATRTTTHKCQFGIEVDSREAHLSGPPRKVYQDWFESLNRASKVFNGNSSELVKPPQNATPNPVLSRTSPQYSLRHPAPRRD